MARNISVGRVDTDKAAATQRDLEKGDRRYWTPGDGRNQIRIMPPPEGHDQYFERAGFHYGIGPDDKMFPCPKLGNARRTCYLCEEADRLMRSKKEDDIADGKELRATKRFLITVVDIGKPKDKFQVWTAGVKAFREVNYYFSDPDWGDVSDLAEGFDFIVIRKGQSLNTEYTVRIAKKPSDFVEFFDGALDEDYSDEIFKELPVLSEFLVYSSDAEMEAALNGVTTSSSRKGKDEEPEDEEDEDEGDKPRGNRRGKGSPDFPDEDEGDEEDAPPARGTGSSRRTKAEEPEDEEAEGEDEEKSRGSARSSGRGTASSSSSRTSSRLRRGLRGS